MTDLKITRESRAGSSGNVRARRAEFRDNVVNSVFTPYFFLCLVLLLGGVSVTLYDAKGLPLLIVAAVMVALIRLLYSIRAELRRGNEQRAQELHLLRLLLQSGSLSSSRTGREGEEA